VLAPVLEKERHYNPLRVTDSDEGEEVIMFCVVLGERRFGMDVASRRGYEEKA
jgi:hypothetical protein